MTEYRDVHQRTGSTELYLEIIKNSSMSNAQKKSINQFVEVLRIGKAGSKVKGRRIGNYLQFLKKTHDYLKKDIDKLTEKELTDFYKDLQDDKIRKQNGTPYSQATKDEFVKALKRYLGWVWGKDSQKYHKGVRWMKEDYKGSNKKAITLEQCNKIIEKGRITRDKCLFMFLFDSGARIEEALNVRLKDLSTNKKDNLKYFIVHLRGQKTKESDRTIPIPLCTKYLNEYLEEHPTPTEPESFLFPIQYDNARKIIREMSKKVLKTFYLKPHELRHSSATHYIQYGGYGAENIGGFYYRYGWKFGSDEALTYIKMHLYGGELGHDKVVKAITSDRVEEMEKQIKQLKQEQADFMKATEAIIKSLTRRKGDKEEIIDLSDRAEEFALQIAEHISRTSKQKEMWEENKKKRLK